MFNFRRRNEREEAKIDKILSSPLIDKILEQAEADSLSTRRTLVASIATLDQQYPAEALRLADATREAYATLERAAAAERAAIQAYHYAAMMQNGHECRHLGQRQDIERELTASADRRIAAFGFQLQKLLENRCVEAFVFWAGPGRRSGEECYHHNGDDIRAIKAMLGECMKRCRAMQLQPLTENEVCEALHDMCTKLAPLLAKIETNPPCMTVADGDVGAPITWNGTPMWTVDQLPFPPVKPDREPSQREVAQTTRRRKLDSLR
jgi:hypothetical protein